MTTVMTLTVEIPDEVVDIAAADFTTPEGQEKYQRYIAYQLGLDDTTELPPIPYHFRWSTE